MYSNAAARTAKPDEQRKEEKIKVKRTKNEAAAVALSFGD